MDRLARVGAISALIAGILEIIAQIVPYVPDSARLETLYAAIDVAFLFALVATVGVLTTRLTRIALSFMLLAIAGVASIIGPDKTAFEIDFYRLGSAIFVLALGAASFWLVRIHDYRRPAIAWIATALLALAAGLSGQVLVFRLTSIVLALGFLFLAQALWREGTRE